MSENHLSENKGNIPSSASKKKITEQTFEKSNIENIY